MIDEQTAKQKLEALITSGVVPLAKQAIIREHLKHCSLAGVRLLCAVALPESFFPASKNVPAGWLQWFEGLVEGVRPSVPASVTPFFDKEIYELIKTIDDLKDEVLRQRLLFSMTLYLEGDHPEEARALFDQLELVTDTSIKFLELSSLEQQLFRQIYVLLAMVYFDILTEESKQYFLKSELVVRALAFGFELSDTAAKYIRSYLMIDQRRQFSLDWAASIRTNNVLLGNAPDGNQMMLGLWPELFRPLFDTSSTTADLANALDKSSELANQEPTVKIIVKEVVLFYYSLVTGEFIFDADGREPVEALAREMEAKESKSVAKPKTAVKSVLILNQTLEKELQAQKNRLGAWLKSATTQEMIARWLKEFKDQKIARRELRKLLQSAAPSLVDQDEIVEALSELDAFLENNGLSVPGGTFIFFNEADGNFYWQD